MMENMTKINNNNTAKTLNLLSVRHFPQIKYHKILKMNILRSLYARITNNSFCFRLINRRYIQAFNKMSVTLDIISEQIVEDLITNGIAFANFSDFFDADLFEEIQTTFSNYLKDFTSLKSKNSNGKEIFLDTIHKLHTFIPNDLISNYLAEPRFASIASHYMGMIPRFNGSSFWHTRPTTMGERIYSQQWHRDYNDRMLTKIFLYLSDVGPKEGYFEYITGSHSRGSMSHLFDKIGSDGYRSYPAIDEVEKFIKKLPIFKLDTIPKELRSGTNTPWHQKPSVVQCLAPKGTLIFVDTFGLHRGGYVESGFRNMIMITYATNFNIHKPHFALTEGFAKKLSPFMQMSFGIGIY